MFRQAFLLLSLPLLAACVKDRTFPAKTTGNNVTIAPGLLRVNEFVATNSVNMNEYGTTEDWFEIYNTASSDVQLAAGEWSVTDGGDGQAGKYVLPELTIPGHGFLVIWCDGLNTVDTQIHTNFSLSSGGEEIAIHHLDGSDYTRIDGYAYGDQNGGEHSNGESNGLQPDGGSTWVVYSTPTPGASNH